MPSDLCRVGLGSARFELADSARQTRLLAGGKIAVNHAALSITIQQGLGGAPGFAHALHVTGLDGFVQLPKRGAQGGAAAAVAVAAYDALTQTLLCRVNIRHWVRDLLDQSLESARLG